VDSVHGGRRRRRRRIAGRLGLALLALLATGGQSAGAGAAPQAAPRPPGAPGEPRGSDAAIRMATDAYYKRPRDHVAATELGASYAVRYSNSGKDADRDAALKYLGEAVALDPNAAAPRAWQGLVKCVQGRDGLSKPLAKEGLALLDQSLERAPDDLDIRLLRASVDLEAPRDFNRLDQALADLEWIERVVGAQPPLAARHGIVVAEVYLKLGQVHRARGDTRRARQALDRAVKQGPETPEGKAAARLLRKLPAD
jgi:tetratricopeptide (TPR) repeat protein